jgi:hypothetical protein
MVPQNNMNGSSKQHERFLKTAGTVPRNSIKTKIFKNPTKIKPPKTL